MRKKIIKFLDKYPKLEIFLKKKYYSFMHFKVIFGKILRDYNFIKKDNRYSKLKELKGKYDGKRCFIVATGPSLKLEDVEKLKDEYTFSMNSIILAFKDTKWRPNFLGLQDWDVYMKVKDILKNEKVDKVFIGRNLSKRIKKENDWIEYPLDLMDHCTEFKKFKTKFSDDCYSIVYDGYTVVYSLMQIAVYMGFKEIYLLGNDCNYKGPKARFMDHGVEVFDKDIVVERYIAAYKVAKEYADKNGIKIYNATRGGNLEVFERVNFDDIIK